MPPHCWCAFVASLALASPPKGRVAPTNQEAHARLATGSPLSSRSSHAFFSPRLPTGTHPTNQVSWGSLPHSHSRSPYPLTSAGPARPAAALSLRVREALYPPQSPPVPGPATLPPRQAVLNRCQPQRRAGHIWLRFAVILASPHHLTANKKKQPATTQPSPPPPDGSAGRRGRGGQGAAPRAEQHRRGRPLHFTAPQALWKGERNLPTQAFRKSKYAQRNRTPLWPRQLHWCIQHITTAPLENGEAGWTGLRVLRIDFREGRGEEASGPSAGLPLGPAEQKQPSPSSPAAPCNIHLPGRRRKANRSPKPHTEAHCSSLRLLPRSTSAPRGRAVWRGGREGRGAERGGDSGRQGPKPA